MPENKADTNDIDALLRYLHSGHTPHWYDDSTRWHAAITALVAERDELKQRHAHLSQSYTMLARECDALKQRVAELEAQEFTLPHEPFRNPDEDLRARLVCAIWPVIMRQWREYKDAIDPRVDARSDALQEADKMLAAMRKGER